MSVMSSFTLTFQCANPLAYLPVLLYRTVLTHAFHSRPRVQSYDLAVCGYGRSPPPSPLDGPGRYYTDSPLPRFRHVGWTQQQPLVQYNITIKPFPRNSKISMTIPNSMQWWPKEKNISSPAGRLKSPPPQLGPCRAEEGYT